MKEKNNSSNANITVLAVSFIVMLVGIMSGSAATVLGAIWLLLFVRPTRSF